MLGFQKINLRDIEDQLGYDKLMQICSSFECPHNKDVESFLHHKAYEFSRQGIAATFLVFASHKQQMVLVGYFSLAQKFFHIDLHKKGNIGSNLRKRMHKFATYDDMLKKHIISSPLIGQLGKNYRDGYNTLITGNELLKIACDTVAEAQKLLGGKIVYLECEDVPYIVNFYQENGFYNFGKRALEADERDSISGKYLIQMLKYI